jgi:acetyl esterase/lipase
MKAYKVDLAKEYGLQGGVLECIIMEPTLDRDYENWKRPAVIVVPGGGYGMVSTREAACVATGFLDRGYQAFVLTYLCAPDDVRYPEQLCELAAAVDYVKKHAQELYVNADEVFAVGFSAGGHLTANLAVDHQNVSARAGQELDCKPTAVGLCYPVITSKHGHFGSYENLLNGYTDEAKEELMKILNLDEVVSEQTPPAFIWTTATDNCVPADNSLRYALALDKQGINYELHVYPRGHHGLSRCNLEINGEFDFLAKASRWIDDCASFFRLYTVEKF